MSLLISSGCVCCWLVSRSISLLGFENLGLKTKDYSFLLGCKHLPEEQHGAWAAKHCGAQPECLSGVWGGQISRRTALHPTLPARLSPVLAVLGISVSWWCHGVVGYRLASPCLLAGRKVWEGKVNCSRAGAVLQRTNSFPEGFWSVGCCFFPSLSFFLSAVEQLISPPRSRSLPFQCLKWGEGLSTSFWHSVGPMLPLSHCPPPWL